MIRLAQENAEYTCGGGGEVQQEKAEEEKSEGREAEVLDLSQVTRSRHLQSWCPCTCLCDFKFSIGGLLAHVNITTHIPVGYLFNTTQR